MTIIQTAKPLAERAPRDYYPTQLELCQAALQCVEGPAPRTILDPGCGQGPWGTAARMLWPEAIITGIDIEVGECAAYDRVITGDFLTHDFGSEGYDLTLGNPPYFASEAFIRKSLGHSTRLILLLRLQFLASKKRGTDLFRNLPPNDVYVLCTRPSFIPSGQSDDNEYGLFYWSLTSKSNGGTNLHWFDWKRGEVIG